MQISISGHHYTVSDRTKSYVEEEVAGLEKFYAPLVDVHVKITEEGRTHRVDLVANVHAHTLKASGDAEQVYPAIDLAVNRMTTQLKKLHDKQRNRRRDSRESIGSGG